MATRTAITSLFPGCLTNECFESRIDEPLDPTAALFVETRHIIIFDASMSVDRRGARLAEGLFKAREPHEIDLSTIFR
jgi:hypothetical protein